MHLHQGADVSARGGIYATVLQAALVPTKLQTHYRITKVNALKMVGVLLDHGADVTCVPGSKYGDAFIAAKELWRHREANLVVFMKLLESKGGR